MTREQMIDEAVLRYYGEWSALRQCWHVGRYGWNRLSRIAGKREIVRSEAAYAIGVFFRQVQREQIHLANVQEHGT